MSSHRPQHRLSVPDIQRRKGAGSLVALTAYSTPMARLLDPHADLLLVGDSLGMVLYGMPSTLGVSLEMMVAHPGGDARQPARLRGGRLAVRQLPGIAPTGVPQRRTPAGRQRRPGGEAGRR